MRSGTRIKIEHMHIRFHEWEWFNLLIHLWNGLCMFIFLSGLLVASEWYGDEHGQPKKTAKGSPPTW